jgi:hypothetical protein
MEMPSSINIRYMLDEEIEAEASALLAGYARRAGAAITVPALLLDDLLQHLGLRFEMDDLRTKLGVPDVLGAIWMEDKRVCIDETLDPDERPAMRGRFNFSLAHEIGHWCLHRACYELRQRIADLFSRPAAPSIICRTSQQKTRIEIQADIFASYLLMPRAEMIKAWQRLIGPEHLKLGDFRAGWAYRSASASLGRGCIRADAREQQDEVIELLIQPLAEEFQVSPQAIRIRLDGLGMIVRETETMEPLFEAT